MRPVYWIAVAFVALLVALAATICWILNSESGARWVAARAVGALAGKLEIAEVRGTIAGPLTISSARYHDAEAGVDMRVAHISVDIALREIFAPRLHVQTLDVAGVDLRLSEPTKKDKEPSTFSLEPPLDILLDRFTLKDARVSRQSKGESRELFVASTGEAIGRWTSDGIAIQKLVVDSPQGNVHLAGNVHDGTQYAGRATGGFRWTLGATQYAGELSGDSKNHQLNAQVRLSAPFFARLNATVGETRAVPWQFTLEVPAFDPRKALLKDRSIEQLAATLRGSGDLTVAEIRGDVAMNRQRLRVEPLRVRLQEHVLRIETLKLIDPAGRGSLIAAGDVQFGAAAAAAQTAARPRGRATDAAAPDSAASTSAPLFWANLVVQWKDVALPKEWVGQPLATYGELKVVGSTATFDANGHLALGPPGRLADIALAITGSPEQIAFERFEVIEKSGNLTANGTVRLKPAFAWQFSARAKNFDPGEIIAGWTGKLGFALDTRGEMTPQGPNAALNIKNLAGTLRGRSLAADAALTLSPEKVIAGNLNARSGKSTVRLTGRSGKTMNVDAAFDIASLDDWVPKAAGRLDGRFHITGTWPKLAIEGSAKGRGLAYSEYSVRAVDVTADVKNPQSPSGTVEMKASEIFAAGFQFAAVELSASGNEKSHTAHLTAKGEPLSTEARIQGARQGDAWSGTVEHLSLTVTGIAPLALVEPAKVTFSPRGFSVSESCLTGEQISACAAATQNPAGELNAKYTLQHVPLGLIAALAVPDMPLRIEAVIEGNGTVRRTPDGALFGETHISSASGRITEATAPAREEAADALLTYENLKLDAQLAGDSANASIESALGGGGSLAGHVALANLRGSSPSLDGHVKATVPDLSPAGLFVPQLADVHGRGEANIDIAGTVSDPQISGHAQLRELSAEVPQVGIKLHDGELDAALSPGNDISLTGKVSSGDGQITLIGATSSLRVLKVKVRGKDFMAANIPGAQVFIEPDLDFARSAESMTLTGTVVVPRAEIDLTKLPHQGGAVQSSSDVIVIDDEAVAKSKNVPLESHVTVVLGKDVTLIGYGLSAKVTGQVVVHDVQGEPTKGSGEIRVTGTYKAYGQDLTIQQGRLLFAGQAINDPQVNLIATRTVDAVTAKLIVSGSAQKPQLEVTADPTMSQTQALSYLVAGKPLNEIGSGEGDRVQSAARSLGGAAGNLLAKGLGKRLGISEMGIEDRAEVGGSAFTVGQYLSPRLYLSYGVGLFEPGQVVTLRYRINDRLSLEAVQGTLNQKAGINYRIEK